MPHAEIVLEGDGAFAEQLATFGPKFVAVPETSLRIVRLAAGMKTGKSSVAIGFELDGNYYVVETSLALFRAAASAMATRDEMEGRPQ